MSLSEILIFSDGGKRILKPDEFERNNFVLQLLGLRQYSTDIKLMETPVYRDLQNNIIYFRDILPVTSSQWDSYMNAIKYGDINQEKLDELKAIINIFGGDKEIEKIIKEMVKKEKIESKYLYPRNPEENIYDMYIFKQSTIANMAIAFNKYDEYTITDVVDNNAPINQQTLYWIRKTKTTS